MTNLARVETYSSGEARFEVTALLTTFTGALMFSWDDLEEAWPHLPQRGIQWPLLSSHDGTTPTVNSRSAIEHLRDALAHGNVAFDTSPDDVITAVRTWTCHSDKTLKRRLDVPVAALREMLACFVAVAEGSDLPLKVPYDCGGGQA